MRTRERDLGTAVSLMASIILGNTVSEKLINPLEIWDFGHEQFEVPDLPYTVGF